MVELNSPQPLSSGEIPDIQNPEKEPTKRSARRFWKPVLIIIGILALALGGAFSARFILPTHPGWSLIPLDRNNVFAQNVVIWMAGRCYAQTRLAEALSEAGKTLEKQCPGAGIGYLDASGRKGGKLLGHLSHKHGRDIDICFLGKDENGRIHPGCPQMFTVGYRLNYKKNGRCGDLKFDRSANLFLILALMEQTAAPVEKIFVEPYIRKWLIEEAEKTERPARTVRQLKQVLRFAGKNAAKHDDHLHVRFALPQK